MMNILILEDDVVIGHAIQVSLDANGYNAKLLSDPIEAKAYFEGNVVDLVLSDINLSHAMDGITFVREIVRESVPVIFLTAYGDKETLGRAELAFPYAYIMKPFHKEQLLLTIKMCLKYAKRRYFRVEHDNDSIATPVQVSLSKREMDVVRLLAHSKTSTEIAEELCISAQTVATHRKNIFRKTRVKSVLELVSLGVERGWL